VCSAFPGLHPYSAIRLISDDPLELVPDILLLRQYREAYRLWNDAQGEGKEKEELRNELLNNELIRWVFEHEYEFVKLDREKRKKKQT